PLRDYLAAGGAFGIGSDSQVSVSPVEELRWLEYGQRLVTRHRNIAVGADSPSVGETLLHAMQGSSPHGTGSEAGDEVVVLDEHARLLDGATPDDLDVRRIVGGSRNLVRGVRVHGKQVVTEGRHRAREAVEARDKQALDRLL